MATTTAKIGVLALQGGFALHKQAFLSLRQSVCEVRKPADLADIDALVLPGGESTALWRLMSAVDMQPAISNFIQVGKPVFATCAGLILLSSPYGLAANQQHRLGLLDVKVERNAYGRQLDSSVVQGQVSPSLQKEAALGVKSMQLPLIRAPRIIECGPAVTSLVSYQQDPVLVRQDNILAATFHPELADDYTVQRYFLKNMLK